MRSLLCRAIRHVRQWSPLRLVFGKLCRVAFICCCSAMIVSLAEAQRAVDFVRDVRPLLSDRCFLCHGPDAATREADLRLDLAESALGELASGDGRAWVAGSPEESVAIQRITSDNDDFRMPPPGSGLSLSPSEKEILRQWVADGAKYQGHWAYHPLPDQIPVPKPKNGLWARNEIDRFILSRMEEAGMQPAPEAERWRWLRRVTLDLTGLPPTIPEIDEFEGDSGPEAYERIVDRLLSSPRFGERMAVPWLDTARYADSYGYQSDLLCNVWQYRDWVIRALNSNMPYDRFLSAQLAGDLFPESCRDDQLATAFNRLHRQTNEGGSLEEEYRTEYAADRVQTFGTAILGLTLECTKCHDHKYDPLTQRDFYSLFAFFNNIDEFGTYNDTAHIPTPALSLPSPEQESRLADLERQIREHAAAYEKLLGECQDAAKEWVIRNGANRFAPTPVSRWSCSRQTSDGQERLTNPIVESGWGSTEPGNRFVVGVSGSESDVAIQCSGDDAITFPLPYELNLPERPFAVSFWLKRPSNLTHGIVWHAESGTDAGFHGTELQLMDGRLQLAIIHFWPGNAMAVITEEAVPADRWVHVCTGYDGSGSAKGLQLYVDGRQATHIVRDGLTKRPGTRMNSITFGARFRSIGLTAGVVDEIQAFDRQLSLLEVQELAKAPSSQGSDALPAEEELHGHYRMAVEPMFQAWRREQQSLLGQLYDVRDAIGEIMTMRELSDARSTYLLDRGAYDAPKTPDRLVQRNVPASLSTWNANWPRNRLGLSQWVTDPGNPLTARVAVNRVWMILFVRGLVESQENFGVQGTPPSHQDLLDWLARDFQKHGWNYKRLCRQIVLSSTYRQTSVCASQKMEQDPQNILLARGPRQRLSGEALRDLVLAASGLLNEKIGGTPVSPYQPPGLWRESNQMTSEYQQGTGGDLYRRSLYTVWKRTAPSPSLTTLDVPGREVCVARRSPTQTPLQALVVLNDVQFVEAARKLAERAMQTNPVSIEEQNDAVFRMLTGRNPTGKERAILSQLRHRQFARFLSRSHASVELLTIGESKADDALDPASVAALTVVVQAILNSDATLWQR
jgi:Protein of unknown function (DUF1553)/Protein of unknown function (DUF1549)/Concanavalin A-like lectin/glucanases superfamily/Planctomycete cytochrome C